MVEDRLREALALLDRVLSARPERDDHGLAHAVARLSEARDALIARDRRGESVHSPALLSGVNAAISAVMAVEFPLGPVPWRVLEATRAWLAEVVGRPVQSSVA